MLPPNESPICQDLMCCNEQHVAQLNKYSNEIIQTCLESAANIIPSTTLINNCTKTLPGWNEHVLPVREKSILWHNIWLECGRPSEGLIDDIMRRTRSAYHYAVRFIKKNISDIVRQRFAIAIVENRNRDFWHEVKKV
jgi:hypothetical protein